MIVLYFIYTSKLDTRNVIVNRNLLLSESKSRCPLQTRLPDRIPIQNVSVTLVVSTTIVDQSVGVGRGGEAAAVVDVSWEVLDAVVVDVGWAVLDAVVEDGWAAHWKQPMS